MAMVTWNDKKLKEGVAKGIDISNPKKGPAMVYKVCFVLLWPRISFPPPP